MTTAARKQVAAAVSRVSAAADRAGREMTFMEVCGTHTVSAFRSGLHSLLPPTVRLLSGPGCPVCVTPQSDIDLLIQLACDHDVTVCTYGDMIRVPGHRGSLEKARGEGAAVRIVYSSLDAVQFAAANRDRRVVFAAVGFETTAPATAAAILEAQRLGLDNFCVLASHKRVLPAMLALLETGDVAIDGFLCPGHVSVIIGESPYQPIVERHGLPCVIAGFEPVQMAEGVASLAEQVADHRCELVNNYPEAVRPKGNPVALRLMDEVFVHGDSNWRGLGRIANSSLVVRPEFQAFDAMAKFSLAPPPEREPAGCRCGEVIAGTATPPQCALFGDACTPLHPVGPCMVSSEGTCQAWFKYHRGSRPQPQMEFVS